MSKSCNSSSPKAKDDKYICNEKTGRWVLKSGTIGQVFSKKVTMSSKHQSTPSIKQIPPSRPKVGPTRLPSKRNQPPLRPKVGPTRLPSNRRYPPPRPMVGPTRFPNKKIITKSFVKENSLKHTSRKKSVKHQSPIKKKLQNLKKR